MMEKVDMAKKTMESQVSTQVFVQQIKNVNL